MGLEIGNTGTNHDATNFHPSVFLSRVIGSYGGSKSFRPDIQKPRQMENAVRDI